MSNESKKGKLLLASVAGILAVGSMASLTAANAAEAGGMVPCYGVNACKGTGDCGGKGYSCAGKNACKGQGFVNLPADACTRIEGGRLTPEAPAQA
jgi:uncharacterized membrane protein